jgi:rubrerythrin
MSPAMEVRMPAAAANEPVRTLAEFMAVALDMESAAAERYAELADAMETANNVEVAALFRKLAKIESGHADTIMAQMGWRAAPDATRRVAPMEIDTAELPRIDDVHYLMQPYHALAIALACEQRAQHYYADMAHTADMESVREAARTLEREERDHVELVRAWMNRIERPVDNWADDPDPPRHTD